MIRKGVIVVTIWLGLIAIVPSLPAADPTNDELVALFEKLDGLGRAAVEHGSFVKLVFDEGDPQFGWLINEDDKSVWVLRDDLVPWEFAKSEPTILPSSWQPRHVRLRSVEDAEFDEFCERLVKSNEADLTVFERLRAPGPSYRLLVSHAAWKKDHGGHIEQLLAREPAFAEGVSAFEAAAMEDLAWLHYLRGVNLLMFADRSDVLPHFQLAAKLAQDCRHAKASLDLIAHLERMIPDGVSAALSNKKLQRLAAC